MSIQGIFVDGLTFQVDGFRITYAVITALMWLFTSLFSIEYFKNERHNMRRYWVFTAITFIATEGVMLSGDLMTTFIFFEILSFTSFVWVIQEETAEAIRAGYTYIFIAIFGGLLLLMGLLLLYNAAGTLSFSGLSEIISGNSETVSGQVYAAGILILFGFGAKAGMFPLHVWLPKAHPVAPSPASALLSGVLTKVGIYGILMTSLEVLSGNPSYGAVILVLGTITMVLGAVLALFSVNIKRTLACSSMSQIGFILVGIGMYHLLVAAGNGEGAATVLSGTVLHMVNHSMIKLCLFMASGVVLMKAGTVDLNRARGFGRSKNALKVAFALGALGISGVPGFNGYFSKTLLHEGIVTYINAVNANGALTGADGSALGGLTGIIVGAANLHVIEWLFLISGGLTLAYMLKLFIAIFVEKNSDAALQKQYDSDRKGMNALSAFVIVGSSLFMFILGIRSVAENLADYMIRSFSSDATSVFTFAPFTWRSLQGGLISLAIGILIYVFIVRKVFIKNGQYVNLWPSKLDLEEAVYRPLLTGVLPLVLGTVARVIACSLDYLIAFARGTVLSERRPRTAEARKRSERIMTLREGTNNVVSRVAENYTFAMMMACIGILVVLGTLVLILAL